MVEKKADQNLGARTTKATRSFTSRVMSSVRPHPSHPFSEPSLPLAWQRAVGEIDLALLRRTDGGEAADDESEEDDEED